MIKKYFFHIIYVPGVVLIASCATKLYLPSASDGEYLQRTNPNITIEDLSEGRQLYVNFCGGCHYLHYPNEFTVAEWNDIYPEMKTRVNLDDTALNKIYYYLITGASDIKLNK